LVESGGLESGKRGAVNGVSYWTRHCWPITILCL